MELVSANHRLERRTANYKPNIWNYDHLQSLTPKYDEEECKREAEMRREEVCGILGELKDPFFKLELIDAIEKLALSHQFEEEISQFLKEMACGKSITSSKHDDPFYIALHFRILRQHGHHVPQDGILQLIDDGEKEMNSKSASLDDRAVHEIFEASYLAAEDEYLFDRAKALASLASNHEDGHQQKIYSDKRPVHWSVTWFNAKKHMNCKRSILHRLAGLSFNMVLVQHQKDLKEILRWWKNLGLAELLTFTRDRVVESFLWAAGMAYEPQYGGLRKWLTKAIVLVLIIDDVYDIYGTKHELEQFTNAVESWDPSEIDHRLPEAIRRCFWALYDTVNDIDHEIQKEKGWNSVSPHLKKVWIGFCKALHVEAQWYHGGHFPSVVEYLENGWTSSSGPVLALHILLGVGQDLTEIVAAFDENREIIHHTSLVIRLCNDQATSKVEQERGDAPSSILCYMREANVTEEEARDHIRETITGSWKKINGLFIRSPHKQQAMIRYVVNIARVINFIYQNGDGFGVQDQDTRNQVQSCLIEPVPLV